MPIIVCLQIPGRGLLCIEKQYDSFGFFEGVFPNRIWCNSLNLESSHSKVTFFYT